MGEKVKRKRSWFLTIVIILVSIIALGTSFLGGFFTSCVMRGNTVGTIGSIVSIMENVGYIYDPVTGEQRELTEDDYADALVNAFLDDYSKYYSPEEYQKQIAESLGEYKGIGIGFYDDDVELDMVIGNSPAYKAGLRVGDKIISAKCGDRTKNFSTATEIIEFLSTCGDNAISLYIDGKGAPAVVYVNEYNASYVLYYDSEKIYEFSSDFGNNPVGVERANTEYTDIPAGNTDTAYIKFDLFEANAAKQLNDALEYMRSRGRTKLIFDLRNNGGGYMRVLTEVASLFINNNGANSVVAYAIDKNGNREVFSTYYNNYKSFITSMVVIANENTASASECLIGAMSHYGALGQSPKDKIVLELNDKGIAKSYGKGIMQTTYILRNGGALKLTTAKIYWPDAQTCIHGTGITEGHKSSKANAVKTALDVL